MSTSAPAFSDTSRTTEASVLEEGAGLAWLPTADKPLVFTDPQSLSFGELNLATSSTPSKQLALTVSDAGGGDGTWQVGLQSQSASQGATITVSPTFLLAPGGTAHADLDRRRRRGGQAGRRLRLRHAAPRR